MTTPTPSKFNLLSVNETGAVELTGQQKLINLAKMDLLESLDKDNKMINRNICSFALYENRKANAVGNTEIPKGTVNIKGKEIDLDNGKYEGIRTQYRKISTTAPAIGESTDGNLAKLDTLFAEMLILDSGNMIEFGPQDSYGSGRTAEQESKKAYEELSKMDEYKDKIERAKKVLGDETHFVVKWTEEQMKMLDRIKNIADKIQGELPVIGAANEIEQKKSALLEEPKADEPTTSETEQPAEIEKKYQHLTAEGLKSNLLVKKHLTK